VENTAQEGLTGDPVPNVKSGFGKRQSVHNLPQSVGIHNHPSAAGETYIAAAERTYVKSRCLQQ
ncbi:MAG: hypothetical protein K2R98_15200, partial [Gemmataceae bacterium]|nr:hypothetical protein [Gemmataceae bacterium]